MAVAVRKTTPDYHDEYSVSTETRSPNRALPRKSAQRLRWHEANPTNHAGRSVARRVGVRPAPDSADVEELLSHFGHGNAERDAREREQLLSRREARRRARLRHRPFGMSAICALFLGVPVGLLACLLWLQASAQTLQRRDSQLKDQATETRFALERTRKEIAALGASPQITSWAQQRHWRPATLQEFDQVTDYGSEGSASGTSTNNQHE
jgi:hypothetical protein